MGMMDFLKKAASVTDKPDANAPAVSKYAEKCALCNGPNAEEKWAGQFWHKKCRRMARKMGKKMVM